MRNLFTNKDEKELNNVDSYTCIRIKSSNEEEVFNLLESNGFTGEYGKERSYEVMDPLYMAIQTEVEYNININHECLNNSDILGTYEIARISEVPYYEILTKLNENGYAEELINKSINNYKLKNNIK